MGCEEKKSNLNFTNLVLFKKSRGNLFTEKPVFCDNGNSIIVSSGPSLYMYSTSTGNFLKELFQSSDNIISYQLHPLQDSLLIAITENGELTVYNLKTSEIEYSIRLKLNQKFLNKQKAPKFDFEGEKGGSDFDWETQPLDSLAHRKFLYAKVKSFHNNPSEIFVWTTWCLHSELQCHLSAFTFNSGKHIRLIQIQKSGLKKSYLNFILNTVQGHEVFIGMSNDHVHAIRYDVQKRPFSIKHYMGFEKTVTCLAFHPTECSFATGDSLGRIVIWRNIFEKHPLKDVLHWHTLPVRDIFFSKFGNYLFSGGEENVLVKWSLNSHNKDFLPRLSSAICHISGHCESSLLSLSTIDNKILIIDFNFQSISTVQHFSKWSAIKGDNKVRIFTMDPRSNNFVLSGRTGHIQFLSLNDDGKFLYTFDVTNRNFITSDADSVIENTEVTHAKFNKDGKWLITAESRWDGSCKESRLKVWMYCEKQNSFALNTNVEFPHEEFAIHSLEISSDNMAATTGGDKKFRLWSIFEHQQTYKKKEYWAVHAVNKYRNLPCVGVDFSKDSSLLAVTFGPVLTIWETESCNLKCALSVPYRKDKLKFCKFGNLELSHLLVTSSETIISSWNVITLSVIWTVPLKVSLLISDPFSTFMVAFSADNSLIIFNPSSSTPDLVLRKVSECPVLVAHCVSDGTGKFCLYFLTADQELYCLEDGEKVRETYSGSEVHRISTPFSGQLAEIQNRVEADRRKGVVVVDRSSNQSVTSLMDAPAHTLPNPSVLCLDFLKGLLVFCKNQAPGGPSVKEVKTDYVSRTKETSVDSAGVDADEMEDKLLDIVKAIFV